GMANGGDDADDDCEKQWIAEADGEAVDDVIDPAIAGANEGKGSADAGVVKLEKRLRRNGYMRVASEVERRINDQTKTVDVTVRIQPGPRYVFGQLAIQGLDILSEPVVRQMWGLKPGDPFDGDYPDHFLGRVREEEIFDNLGETRAAVNLNDGNHTADVTLVFHGESPKPKKPAESNR
ncbi:MAG: hypothetical protein ABSD56_05590, partial [Bryobacteraceae bacterium]